MTIAAPSLLALATLAAVAGSAQAQDVAKGKAIFNQCLACHALDHALVGPPLGGIVGRPAGSVAGYRYSPLMKAAGDAGLVWDEQAIVDYLPNTTAYLKAYLASKGKVPSGLSKMYYLLADEDQRKAVVAYLATTKK